MNQPIVLKKGILNLLKTLLIFSVLIRNAEGQNTDYTYIPSTDFEIPATLLLQFEKDHKESADKFTFRDSKHRKQWLAMVNSFTRSVSKMVGDEKLADTGDIASCLDSIIQIIVDNNPSLRGRNIKLWLRRSSYPNASSYGKGLICVDVDLLAKVSKPEHLIFIICHELAHEIGEDVSWGLFKKAELLTDKNFKKKIKKTSRQKYNAKSATIDTINTFFSEHLKYSREVELVADSVGAILFMQCGFSASVAQDALLEIDSLDQLLYRTKIDIQRFFKPSEIEIKEDWLQQEEITGTLGHSVKIWFIPDSLKTHPDCKFRAEKLENIPHVVNEVNHSDALPTWGKIQKQARYELIRLLTDQEELDLAAYYTLASIQTGDENPFLHAALCEILTRIWYARKYHYFSNVVRPYSVREDKNFNGVLYFLHHIPSAALKEVIEKYATTTLVDNHHDYTNYVRIFVESINVEKPDVDAFINEQSQTLQKEYYKHKLTSFFSNHSSKP